MKKRGIRGKINLSKEKEKKRLKSKILKYSVIVIVLILIIFLVMIFTQNKTQETNLQDEKYHIVTSFYPNYILALNLIEGIENVQLTNMLDTNVGCIHDYTLTTTDLKKLENADVFIINGLGLEDHLINRVTKTYPSLKVIDASSNIIKEELIKEENSEEVNPHVWTSITLYQKQVEAVADFLKELNPENSGKYEENKEKYLAKLDELKKEYEETFENQTLKAVSLNESLEYFKQNLNLSLISIATDHEESTLSGEKMGEVIDKMKQEEIKVVIIDKEDNDKNAQTLIKETEAKIKRLNSGLEGKEDLDSYLDIMRENLEVLKNS